MKTLMSLVLGAACLAFFLSNSYQVDSFVVVGSARPALQWAASTRSRQGLRRGRSSSCYTNCRMGTAADDGARPTQGFGQTNVPGKTAKKGKRKKAATEKAEGAAAEVGGKGTGNRQLFMQFTCNQCEGVSQYMINKAAYDDGIVICTCQTCQVRHLIADNLKKMDFPHFGNNIEDFMQSTGSPGEVTKGRAPDLTPEVIEKFDVSVGEDGVLTLSPKAPTADKASP